MSQPARDARMSSYEVVTALRMRRPFHPIFLPIPAACFVGALLTDIAYWRTAEMMWTNFSAWLVSAGVVLGFLALIAGLIDLIGRRFVGPPGAVWLYAVANIVVLVLGTLNMFVHTRDAWTSVVPWGLALSAATVLILLATGWIGWWMVYERDVEVVEP